MLTSPFLQKSQLCLLVAIGTCDPNDNNNGGEHSLGPCSVWVLG